MRYLHDFIRQNDPQKKQTCSNWGFVVVLESIGEIKRICGVQGSRKEILKFFEKLTHELAMDFNSINHLSSLAYNYSIENNKKN